MRILLQTYAFWPSWGGVQKFVHSLYRYMRSHHCNIRLATANRIVISEKEKYFVWPWSNKLGVKSNGFGFTAISLARAHGKFDPRKILFRIYSAFAYFRYCLSLLLFRPQIVHLIYINVDAVFAVRAKKHFGFKLLTSCRGSDILAVDEKNRFTQQVVLETLRSSDAITAVSNEVGAKVRALLHDDTIPVHVVPNGIEFNDSRGATRQTNGAKYFIFAGHMDENKNPAFVIGAFNAFRSSHPDYKLKLIGSGPLLDSLKAMVAESGLDHAIEFPGAVSSQQAKEYIVNAVALIIASAREGCPNVVLEAMSARTVVIGSNRSGIKEIIRHNENGLLFDYNNSGQLIKCMEQIVQSEDLRERLIENAAATIRLDHNQNDVMQRYLLLYRQLCDAG